MNSVDKAVDTIANCIINAVQVISKKQDYNTKNPTGTIKEVLTSNNYRVEIQGSYYTLYDSTSHAVGDVVEIIIPNNDYSRMRINNI